MTREVRNCPFCGRFLPEEIWKEKNAPLSKGDQTPQDKPQRTFVKHEGIKCPYCGSTKVWKNAKYFTAKGEDLQRYLCRDCGFRFVKR